MTTSNDMTDNNRTSGVTDGDNRLSRQEVVDDNWVDRYLIGQLTESEAMAFEDFYASCSETMTELEETTLLIEGLKRTPQSVTDLNSVRAARNAKTAPQPQERSNWLATAASFAAGLAVMFVGAGMLNDSSGPEVAGVAASTVTIVALAPSRGDERGIVVEEDSASAPIVLSLDVGYDVEDRYSASVQNKQGDIVWQTDSLTPDEATQSLNILLDRSMLPAGEYQVVARPVSGNSSTLYYTLTTE
ncbi:MAG: hypothetical protein AAAFM81_04075 [Pseudomonadota bacterium]